MPDLRTVVIEIVGEGKSDLGLTAPNPTIDPPTTGIVPILVHKLCGSPADMKVKRRDVAFLQRGSLEQKVKFSKRQAKYNGSAGLVFVVDTEGDHPDQLDRLVRGRDSEHHDFPAAVGVAHPCIESWLLCDAKAIKRALGLSSLLGGVPDRPEELPAPHQDRNHNPKTVLAGCTGKLPKVPTSDMARIAVELRDLELLRDRCPLSFGPFLVEVEQRIRPIFVGADPTV